MLHDRLVAQAAHEVRRRTPFCATRPRRVPPRAPRRRFRASLRQWWSTLVGLLPQTIRHDEARERLQVCPEPVRSVLPAVPRPGCDGSPARRAARRRTSARPRRTGSACRGRRRDRGTCRATVVHQAVGGGGEVRPQLRVGARRDGQLEPRVERRAREHGPQEVDRRRRAIGALGQPVEGLQELTWRRVEEVLDGGGDQLDLGREVVAAAPPGRARPAARSPGCWCGRSRGRSGRRSSRPAGAPASRRCDRPGSCGSSRRLRSRAPV